MDPREETNKTEEFVEIRQLTEGQPLPKLIFLGLLTLALCSFPPFTILAPVPLTMGILLFGRSKGLIVGVAVMAILFFLSSQLPQTFSLGGVSAVMTVLYSFLISETIFKKVPPVKGLISSGMLVVGLICVIWLGAKFLGGFSVEKMVATNVDQMIEALKSGKNAEILKSGQGEEVRYLQDIVKEPNILVDKILAWLPATIFISVFLSLWAGFFLVLRNWPIWRQKIDYPHSLKELTKFKVPDFFVYPLIIGLALVLTGEYLLGEMGMTIGTNILYMMGVFYFFQGFGVFLDFLTHLKVFGFFRSLMVAMSLLLAWRVLVFVGVFDLWINFRKFFKKKDKGDNE